MAAVVAPFVMAGALATYLHQRDSAVTPKRDPTDEERRAMQQMEDLHYNGANASVWGVNHNKIFMMGQTLNEILSLDVSQGGYHENKNYDPLHAIFGDHVQLSNYDRVDTMRSLRTNNGEIRMRRRMPIAATLTPEIHNPANPAESTTFAMDRMLPNWANEAQLDQVRRNFDPSATYDSLLMPYWDTEFFGRAPGQSFRYE